MRGGDRPLPSVAWGYLHKAETKETRSKAHRKKAHKGLGQNRPNNLRREFILNKKLIAILTLVMFAMTLLPMGAFAATTNTALQVKTVGTTDNERAGDLRITETTATKGSIATGDTITFSLLNGAEFADFDAITNPNAITTADFKNAAAVVAQSETSITIEVAAEETAIEFLLSQVDLDLTSLTGDEVKVDVYSPQGGVTNGQVTVATVASGDTKATVLSTKIFSVGKNEQSAGTLRIVETRAGSLASGDVIKLSIPTEDVVFFDTVTATITNDGDGFALASLTSTTPDENADGYSEVVFKVTGESTTSPATIEITGIKVNVDDDAQLGDVHIKVAGDATSQTLLLGSTRTYGFTLTTEGVINVMAGDETETLKDIVLKEEVAATIIGNGRTIKLTLPTDVAWVSAPEANVDKGTGLVIGGATLSNDRRTATYSFAANTDFSDTAMTFKFEDGKIAVKASAAEKEVTVTVDGSSNVAGELTVAEIVKPVSITAAAIDVEIGKQAQPIGDILIKEVKAGYLKADRTIVIGFDKAGTASFAGTPVVEVIEGDLKIDDVKKSSTEITITLDRVSTEESTIKISGLTLDLDRTPAEGEYKLKVYGTAINRVFAATGTTADDVIEALDAAKTNGLSFVAMTVVTPAVDGVVKPVVMTVGSTVYTIGGVEHQMDIAPYIKNSRTYFPVRFVAQSVGISADNVVWDEARRTVTIFRANRIVQVTIDSNIMLVNGVPVTMDVAPEITASRTMLPIRFVAQGLGINVTWDEATQTVTLN